MKYHELNVDSHKDRKRVGRGIAAGQGKTAGRGTKGQGARTGKKLGFGFMGGQRQLMQAIPKLRGFKSLRVPAQVVFLENLNAFTGKVADNITLYEAGIIATPYHSVKVILRGEITKAINLKVQGASASVKAAITKAGGTFEAVAVPLNKSSKQKDEK